MARTRSNNPTPAELAILRVLWTRGPGNVTQIRDGLEGSADIGYTTVLKTLQIMTGKGLVLRSEQSRAHIYRAAVTEKATQHRLVRDLIDRAFGGSSVDLVLRALSARPASGKELTEIRKLLDRTEDNS
jgi:predicted transcriptional regulator